MQEQRTKRSPLAWEPAAAFACFAGSLLALMTGFVLTTGWILDFEVHPFLHGLGLTLLIVGIPLLILGGHFMDLRERKIRKSHLLILVIALSVFSVKAKPGAGVKLDHGDSDQAVTCRKGITNGAGGA